MKRILIVGSGCAGKSTLAVKLGEVLGLPVYHLDRYFWSAGWIMRDRDDFLADLHDLLNRDEWIIDGNYGRTLHYRIPHTDTIIWIDLPRWRIMLRMVKRVVGTYGRNRPDMADGCKEHFDWGFVKWLWGWPRQEKDLLRNMLRIYGKDKILHHLKSPREVKRFLADLTGNNSECCKTPSFDSTFDS